MWMRRGSGGDEGAAWRRGLESRARGMENAGDCLEMRQCGAYGAAKRVAQVGPEDRGWKLEDGGGRAAVLLYPPSSILYPQAQAWNGHRLFQRLPL